MDGLLVLLFFFWVLKKIGSKKEKPKKRKTASPNVSREEQLRRVIAELQKQKAQQKPQTVPAPPVAEQLEMTAVEGESQHPASAWTMGSEYVGSLNVDSNEGEDLCDPSLEHERDVRYETDSVYAGEIGDRPSVSFDPRAIVQGVVMSEVLSAPRSMRRR